MSFQIDLFYSQHGLYVAYCYSAFLTVLIKYIVIVRYLHFGFFFVWFVLYTRYSFENDDYIKSVHFFYMID